MMIYQVTQKPVTYPIITGHKDDIPVGRLDQASAVV